MLFVIVAYALYVRSSFMHNIPSILTNGFLFFLLEINATGEPWTLSNTSNTSKVDDRADIIYQKDASFSAVLDTRRNVEDNAIATVAVEAVHFITTTATSSSSSNFENKTFSQSASAKWSPSVESFRANDSSCAKSCGAGSCIIEVADSDDDDIDADSNQRCQCILGKTGPNCQTGKLCLYLNREKLVVLFPHFVVPHIASYTRT